MNGNFLFKQNKRFRGACVCEEWFQMKVMSCQQKTLGLTKSFFFKHTFTRHHTIGVLPTSQAGLNTKRIDIHVTIKELSSRQHSYCQPQIEKVFHLKDDEYYKAQIKPLQKEIRTDFDLSLKMELHCQGHTMIFDSMGNTKHT